MTDIQKSDLPELIQWADAIQNILPGFNFPAATEMQPEARFGALLEAVLKHHQTRDQHFEILSLLCDQIAHTESLFLWFWDLANEELLIGRKTAALFDAKQGKQLRNWNSLIPIEDRIVLEQTLKACTQDAPAQSARLKIRASNGNWNEIIWHAYATAWDETGLPARLCGFLNNTKQKKSKTSGDEELIGRIEKAEQASQAKSLFLANLSHEIRTPINSVLGLTTLLGTTHVSVEQAEYIRLIKASADSVVSMLSNILDFSKIEAGCLELDPVAFSLARLCSDTLRALSLDAQRKGIEVIIDLAPDLPDPIRGDPTRIKQIITNLFQNAVKFTEHGEISLTVSAEPASGERLALTLTVNDSGCGISPEACRRIFDIYEQADRSISGKFGGFGLGLSIARRLTQLMGGDLSVKSEVGKGSAFSAKIRVEVPTRTSEAGKQKDCIEKHCLIIEDNHTQAEAIAKLLRSQGCTVSTVASPQAALQKISAYLAGSAPLDWILVNSPLYEDAVLESELQLARLHAARVILLSSVSTNPADSVLLAEHKIDSIVVKPLTIVDWRDVLNQLKEQNELLAPVTLGNQTISTSTAQGKKRILLAEDNPVNRHVMAMLLEKAGYQVTAVADGQAALDYLETERFAVDLILLDLQMPRMDGITATESIRLQEMRRSWLIEFGPQQLPIIGLTGDLGTDTNRRCQAAGMTKLLTKPLPTDTLLREVASILLNSERDSGLHDLGEMANLIQSQIGGHMGALMSEQAQHEWRMQGAPLPPSPPTLNRLPPFMINEFFQGLAEVMPRIQSALKAKEHEQLALLSLKLQSMLSAIGGDHVINVTQQLQEAAEQRDHKRQIILYENLMAELNPLCQSMRSGQRSPKQNESF